MRGSFILHLDPSKGVINICAVAEYNAPHGSMSKEVEREGIFTLSDVVRVAEAAAVRFPFIRP